MRGIYSNKTKSVTRYLLKLPVWHMMTVHCHELKIYHMKLFPEKSENITIISFWNVPSLVNVFVQQWDFPIRKMSEHAPLSKELMPAQLMRNTTIPHLLTLLSLHAMHVLRNVFLLQTHVRDV